MADQSEERKQWHPVLADGLRYLLEPRLRVEPEHALAVLPTRVDVMLLAGEAPQELAFPYCHLGATTLLELETPGEYATWRILRKLYADSALYTLAEGIEDAADVTVAGGEPRVGGVPVPGGA